MLDHQEYLQTILNFITNIGIPIIEKTLPDETFLPGLDLGSNCIFLDYAKLLHVGDLLHEAGHLAVTSGQQRAAVGTDELVLPWPTDGEEIAAVLWSYAAAKYLGLPLDIVFHEGGYKNDSAWLIASFSSGNYIGLPLLQWMGLCLDAEQAQRQNLPAFPHMQRWLRH